MGLGPRASNLLARINAAEPIWSNPFAMQLEAQQRGEARREKAIWHAQRHTTPKRPEAPALPLGKVKGKDRGWLWNGESIGSKGLYNGHEYLASEIRKAGFKLPKIAKLKKQKAVET